MWTNLRHRFESWLFTKGVLLGFAHLEAKHVGMRLNEAMDRINKEKSDEVQKALAKWLHHVEQELLL